MNLSQIQADLFRRLNYGTAPAAEVSMRLTAFVAETLQELLSEPGIGQWITEHVPPVTFASVANTATYGLPPTVQRIDAITERVNNRKLDMRGWTWYRSQNPDPTIFSGTPDVWVPLGYQAVTSQPSAATGLWAVSTSASDVQNAYLESVVTGGFPRVTPATVLTGTSRVQLGSQATHIEVTKFYVATPAVGAISLYDAASSGNELARIPIGSTFSRYQGIALWPTPAAAITYYVDGENALPDMANPTDEPPFPARFHRILVDGALSREYEKRGGEYLPLMAAARKRYNNTLGQLRYFVTCPPDFLPTRSDRTLGRSRFGAQYPVTRY